MRLDSLRVLHIQKDGPSSFASIEIPGSLLLNSCQRLLWIYDGEQTAVMPPLGASLFRGVDAYRFLLRVSCGLESEVTGETEIFGQLKDAWRKSISEIDASVDYWVQKCFEDTKEIRSRHLENLGGASYGSLVRKFFGGRETKRTLLVGAGGLAASIAPYLVSRSGGELWITNRNSARAHELRAQLVKNEPSASISVIEADRAWSDAERIVICVPASAVDSFRIETIRGRNCEVLHLGARREEAGDWALIPNSGFLDDLFRLQKAQGEARSAQIRLADRACEERAKLRSLGGGMSVAHGWEDLAVFA